MDIIDQANDIAEEMLRRQIAYVTSKTDAFPPIGECYNCQQSVPAGVRYCDSDCRDDHEKRRRK